VNRLSGRRKGEENKGRERAKKREGGGEGRREGRGREMKYFAAWQRRRLKLRRKQKMMYL